MSHVQRRRQPQRQVDVFQAGHLAGRRGRVRAGRAGGSAGVAAHNVIHSGNAGGQLQSNVRQLHQQHVSGGACAGGSGCRRVQESVHKAKVRRQADAQAMDEHYGGLGRLQGREALEAEIFVLLFGVAGREMRGRDYYYQGIAGDLFFPVD